MISEEEKLKLLKDVAVLKRELKNQTELNRKTASEISSMSINTQKLLILVGVSADKMAEQKNDFKDLESEVRHQERDIKILANEVARLKFISYGAIIAGGGFFALLKLFGKFFSFDLD